MKSHLPFRCSLLVAMTLMCAQAWAQQVNSPNDKQDASLREKAFKLLQSLSGEIGSLQSAENRARLGSNIAGSLWPYDEARARALFATVENDIKQGLENSPSPNPDDYPTLMVFMKLRVDSVRRIATHDAELAFQFFKATELDSERELSPYVKEWHRKLELDLAKDLARQNPDLAVEISRRSLSAGFSNELVPVLMTLQRKHKEQASVLYRDIVLKLRDANLRRDLNARYLAVNLARTFGPPTTDESVYRDLINKFIKTASALKCDKNISDDYERNMVCSQIGTLLTEIEKVDPQRAAQLKQWRHEVNGWERAREGYEELAETVRGGNVDEILALVHDYPQLEADIYLQAIQKAQSSGDMERARQIATEYKGTPGLRERMLSLVDEKNVFDSLTKDPQALEVAMGAFSRPIGKAKYLAGIAYLVKSKDPTAALKLMDQANGIVESMKPGKDQTEAQIILAIIYCSSKSDKGWTIIETLLPKLNELIAAAIKLDGYETSNVRDGEWNMSAEGNLGNLLTMMAENAGFFAWADFDRAVDLTRQFERPEIRMMAQLKLAQGILGGKNQVPRIPVPLLNPSIY